jgi:hypothetical protein
MGWTGYCTSQSAPRVDGRDGAWIEDQLGSVFSGPTGRLRAFEATSVQAKYDGVTRLEVGEDVWTITLFEHDATKLTS